MMEEMMQNLVAKRKEKERGEGKNSREFWHKEFFWGKLLRKI